MKTSASLAPSALSSTELEQLQPALAARFPLVKGVLGSQLGAFIRRHLTNPDLRGRFGGLKEFIALYFPAEIVWRGRRGLDDLYDISFIPDGSETSIWQPVPTEPSSALWSAVTNPSIYVQFAWSAKEESLLQASAGIALPDELAPIKKLTKADYQNFAIEFVNLMESNDSSGRAQALESSGSAAEFTRLMRERGLLAKWEEFRIDRARREFVDRLGGSGIDESIVARWADILRLSQQKARSQRLRKTVVVAAARPSQPLARRAQGAGGMLDSRAVAIKALEFLSDSELSDLKLPLGTVMRAFGSLMGRS
jgi:hypothetical protein